MAHEPTNAEVLEKVEEMYAGVDRRLKPLEDWKVSEDAYRAALAKIKAEETENKRSTLKDAEMLRRTELMKQGGIILGLIIAILYAYMATKGIKP